MALGVLETLELLGIFVFAISGALLGVRRGFDLVGMLALAESTALGGGVLRDLIIGATPPAAFVEPTYLAIPLVATVLTFFVHRQIDRLNVAILVFDAGGLGLFCVTGTLKALEYGLGPVQAVALGVTTAVGGGVLRDVLANEVPTILRADSEVYAIPAVVAAAIVAVDWQVGAATPYVAILAAVVGFMLRIAALRYRWRAPRAWRTTERDADSTGQ